MRLHSPAKTALPVAALGTGALFAHEKVVRFLRKQLFPAHAAERAQAAFETAFSRVSNETQDALFVITEEDAAHRIGSMLGALVAGKSAFCDNPHWGETEKREAQTEREAWRNSAQPHLLIPTGGTGGRVRFIAHTETTLSAAANAQNIALGGAPLDTVSPLPLWHVSGIMPVLRALFSGGRLTLCNGSFNAEKLPSPNLSPTDTPRYISLAPTQLRRLLTRADTAGSVWLRQFDTVLLGGAAVSADLLALACHEKIRVAIGYGMTETAAFVALVTPENFFAQTASQSPLFGNILPHANIRILDPHGTPLPAATAGQISIAADSLAPDLGEIGTDGVRRFITQDEGVLENGRLRLIGRTDRFIVTGGEKVDPRRVEAALLTSPLVRAALVVGEPDPEWGTRVTALVELTPAATATQHWRTALSRVTQRALARHCTPKRWVAVPRLPFDERGKLDRNALAAALMPTPQDGDVPPAAA
ncbi:MAG: AMP-binding protein [Puniceicoccales bacterium]|jgi:O-succinylbenzoic acid--CoA ligase|nr:AMP-binding protein [Puniceicoccales bacterium]